MLSFDENRGLREGIAAGYAYADERGYEFVGRVDADGQHPVDELARLLEIVSAGQADVAIGSRFATGEGYEAFRYEPSSSRRLGTVGPSPGDARHSRATVPRCDERDVCGESARDAALGIPYTSRAPEVESLLRLRDAGLDVVEVPGAHARTGERRVEVAREQGGQARVTVTGTLIAYGVWRRLRRRA